MFGDEGGCVRGVGVRDTGCCFMVVVPDCTQAKLHGLIFQWIIIGTSFSGSSLEHPSADQLGIILQQIIFGSSFSVSCLDHPSADQT